ncbi:MAG TPA: hypothetical protein VEG30_07760 [Terriglobales bacterium]|nr:hypothetical protein [Terriglobales bacterium]
MSPFPFFQRENLGQLARQLDLKAYTPVIELQGLVPGVDNVRYDVFLSPILTEVARQHIARVIAKAGNVEDLIVDRRTPLGSPAFLSRTQKPAPAPDVSEFKRRLTELHVASLNRSKAENNVSLDLLFRIAILKFLRSELGEQCSSILEKLRTRANTYDGPRQTNNSAVQSRERCAAFQRNKKSILCRAGEEIFHTLREIEKETLLRMRRSLFGSADFVGYDLFINHLVFTENGRDDQVNAEHYVMLGNFERDPDRFHRLLAIAVDYLKSMEIGSDEQELIPILSVPENAHDLVGNGVPDEDTHEGRLQKALLETWTECLEREGVLNHVIAAYDTVPLLAEYSPTINPQQLKNALIWRQERQRVEKLLEEQGKLSPANFQAAVKRFANYRGSDRAKFGGRFLRDFMRYHRDLRRLETLLAAMEGISLLTSEKLRSLSEINSTLYEFPLPEEQKPAEDRILHHIILKADIRDSTTLTRTLFERGLNPASYFSLNFYDPVNKLLPKYQATKVFIEGDAVILALFEREGGEGFGVGRTCALAREMSTLVRAYNAQSEKSGLPTLELGIGISYQDAAPMYLMDGQSRIMISKALNESDRLSSCNRGARKILEGSETLFNVFCFQTVDDEDTGGNPDEFLMRYNIGGIHMSEPAYRKLRQEISLQPIEMELPTLWENEPVTLHTGLVSVGQSFHRLVIREGSIARIGAQGFSLKKWTDRRYYEVCTHEDIYKLVELWLRNKGEAEGIGMFTSQAESRPVTALR